MTATLGQLFAELKQHSKLFQINLKVKYDHQLTNI